MREKIRKAPPTRRLMISREEFIRKMWDIFLEKN